MSLPHDGQQHPGRRADPVGVLIFACTAVFTGLMALVFAQDDTIVPLIAAAIFSAVGAASVACAVTCGKGQWPFVITRVNDRDSPHQLDEATRRPPWGGRLYAFWARRTQGIVFRLFLLYSNESQM